MKPNTNYQFRYSDGDGDCTIKITTDSEGNFPDCINPMLYTVEELVEAASFQYLSDFEYNQGDGMEFWEEIKD